MEDEKAKGASEKFHGDICKERMKRMGVQVAWPRPHDDKYEDDSKLKPPRVA